MQDIVAELCEKIRELINHTLGRRETENQRRLKWLERRLSGLTKRIAALEKSRPKTEDATEKSKPPKCKKYRMKGASVIAIRSRLQLTQAMFARLLGVNRSCVNHWEHDKVKPSQRTMAKIAEYRGMSKKALKERIQKLEEEMWNK